MRARKVDANHGAVRDFLREHGWAVRSLASIGYDLPDFVVAREHFTALVEVKDGSKSPSKRKLSEGQESFRKTWPGIVITALNPEHALLQLEAWKNATFMARTPI